MDLPEFHPKHDHFLDKSVVVYGASSAGKTTIIKDIMFTVKDWISAVFVIAPTDKTNKSYSSFIPLPLIHYEQPERLIDDIWERQEAAVAVYDRANNLKVIIDLFNIIADDNAYDRIDLLNRKFAEKKVAIKNSGELPHIISQQISELEDKMAEWKLIIYKYYIRKNLHRLEKRRDLTKDEKFSLKYLDLNPRILIIWDDAAMILEKYRKTKVMNNLYYQGRHNKITFIIAGHTDKSFLPEQKKQVRVIIFADKPTSMAYINRSSTDMPKPEKARAIAALNAALIPTLPYQKLVYISREDKYYRYTAKVRKNIDIIKGPLKQYCESCAKEPGSVSSNNKFTRVFV